MIEVLWGASSVITAPIWGTGAIAIATGVAVGYASYKGVQYANDWLTTREHAILEQKFAEQGILADRIDKGKQGKQRDGTPGSNVAQNNQFDDAVKEIERKLGKKLSDDDRKKLHIQISGENYGYHDIIDEGCWMFHE